MSITSQHFKMLSCLVVNNYSINELSEILNISIFKVRRYISDLEYILKDEGILLIHEKLKETPNILGEIKNIQRFTPKERESYLILQFLKSNTINLTSISEKISVTRRTLANDIKHLKKELEFFHLKIVSYNSYGISLEGLEKNKRKFFELYFIKMLIEEKYLPIAFQEFFVELKKLKKEYKLSEKIDKIYEIYEGWGILRHTYVNLHIEVSMYLAIIRKEFEDESLERHMEINEECKIKDIKKLNLVLEEIKFFSNYERFSIREFYLKRNRDKFFEANRVEVLELKNLLNYLNKKLKIEITLSEDILIRLTAVIAVMKFKELFEIVEIYLFNNKVAEDYFDKFKLISNLVKKYYKNIDSFDRTILSMTILNEINKEFERKIEKLKDIVIVYNFLGIEFIKDIFKELELKGLMDSIKLISYRDVDDYLENNEIKGIILFEDIKLDEKYDNIKKVRFNLPIIKLDKFRLSVFI